MTGMVLPPVGRDGDVDSRCADLSDVRVPAARGRYTDDPRYARPVGHYHGRPPAGGGLRDEPGPCNPTGQWGRNRHLFDALEVSEGDRYDTEDNLVPKRFELVLTCVRCGLVEAMRGQLDPAVPGSREITHLDPVPLQAGVLLAQEVDRLHDWGQVWHIRWTVYADGKRIGSMTTARGPRGKRYITGHLGTFDLAQEGDPQARGDSPLAVLRKLSKLATSTSSDLAGSAPAGR